MTYLILGATGTLGRATIKKLLLDKTTDRITCLSRDELKQSEMRKEFTDGRLHFVIGDIRDKQSIERHFGVDVVFHFAALKRVPEMEAHPLEALKTNVHGTINAIECALEYGVDHFVFSSTDKACRPINTYGATKFLSEQILLNFNGLDEINISVYRWANVIGSRGSVLFSFHDSIKEQKKAHITHPDMTRMWIRLEDAVDFMLGTYKEPSVKIKIPKLKGASVLRVLDTISQVTNQPAPFAIVGLRPGEKIHEDLVFDVEAGACVSSDTVEQYTNSELAELIRTVL